MICRRCKDTGSVVVARQTVPCPACRRIVIELPLPPEVLHPNSRASWKAKVRPTRKTRSETAWVARISAPPRPFKSATIRATFHLLRRRDGDGLNAWLKAVLDGLQGIVIENDSGVTLLPPIQTIGRERKLILEIEASD